MLVKWKTSRHSKSGIERVQCTRETDKAVWVLEHSWSLGASKRPPVENRRMKMTDGDQYHDTWEAAHAYLLDRAETELNRARTRLAKAQATFGNVKGLRKPADSGQVPAQETLPTAAA